jgi:hypothetical protein
MALFSLLLELTSKRIYQEKGMVHVFGDHWKAVGGTEHDE